MITINQKKPIFIKILITDGLNFSDFNSMGLPLLPRKSSLWVLFFHLYQSTYGQRRSHERFHPFHLMDGDDKGCTIHPLPALLQLNDDRHLFQYWDLSVIFLLLF